MLLKKTFLDHANLFCLNDYKKNDKIICKCFKEKISNLEFRFKKIVEPRNYLLDDLKHNDVMSEKHKINVGI